MTTQTGHLIFTGFLALAAMTAVGAWLASKWSRAARRPVLALGKPVRILPLLNLAYPFGWEKVPEDELAIDLINAADAYLHHAFMTSSFGPVDPASVEVPSTWPWADDMWHNPDSHLALELAAACALTARDLPLVVKA
jgi:hypothetical protein